MSLNDPSTDPEAIAVAAGADERFAVGLTVTLTSALRRLDPSRRAHIFVLDGGLSPESRERCLACLRLARPDVEVTLVDEDPSRFAGLHVHGYSKAAYLRLLVPEVVSDSYRRVLYLDSDLVVEDDIARLWSLPDEGKALWAACDAGIREPSHFRDRLGVAGIPENTPYFNSGVLLINLPRWKAAHVSERALDLLVEHSERWLEPDQDALNVAAVDNWSALPPTWNFQVVGLQAWSAAPEDPNATISITHYVNKKPWLLHLRCLRQDVFDKALRASGWYSPLAYWRYFLRRRIVDVPALRPLLDARRRLLQRSRRNAVQSG